MIKRTSRAEIRRILYHGTPKERVRLYEEDNFLNSEEEGTILTDEDTNLLGENMTKEEKKEYDYYLYHLRNMAKRRAYFLLYERQLTILSTLVNTHLKEIDIYTMEAYTFNDIIDDLKEEYGAEATKAAFSGSSKLPSKISQKEVERLLSHKSIDKELINLRYSPEREIFIVDATPLEAKLREALEDFRFNMEEGKLLDIMIHRYAKKYKVEEFIPRSIEAVIGRIKQEWAANKRFSSSYYKQLLKSTELEDIIKANQMEDNKDILFLFPSYDDIEIKEEDLKYNIFENG